MVAWWRPWISDIHGPLTPLQLMRTERERQSSTSRRTLFLYRHHAWVVFQFVQSYLCYDDAKKDTQLLVCWHQLFTWCRYVRHGEDLLADILPLSSFPTFLKNTWGLKSLMIPMIPLPREREIWRIHAPQNRCPAPLNGHTVNAANLKLG